MSDNVNKPSHYSAGNVETIDAIKSALGDAFLDYCRGNVLKYVWRCRHKGKLLEDLRKAAKYLEWAIGAAESENPNKPEPLPIPEGWKELEPRETPLSSDMYEHEGMWMRRFDDANCEYEWYDVRHIRKIEAEKPEHVEGVWVEEADANSKKIEPAETSDAAIPDPGPGYRLLSKDPPERVVKNDEYLFSNGKWIESESWRAGGVQCSAYYRRKIEPTEWIPKVGDRVRVAKEREVWRYGTIEDIHPGGDLFLFTSDDGRFQGWLLADKLQLIEAAS